MKWVILVMFGFMTLLLLFGFPDISENTKFIATYIGCCIIMAAEYVEAAIERVMDR